MARAVSRSRNVSKNVIWVHIHGLVYIFLTIILWLLGRCCYKLSKHQIIDGSLSPFIYTVMLRLKSETSSVVILNKKIRLQKIKIEQLTVTNITIMESSVHGSYHLQTRHVYSFQRYKLITKTCNWSWKQYQ